MRVLKVINPTLRVVKTLLKGGFSETWVLSEERDKLKKEPQGS
jgi:hypothetical protein